MSMNLFWKPNDVKGAVLSDRLKFALRKSKTMSTRYTFSEYDIPYLQGLYDAGIDDAEVLIHAIQKHGSIKVWEE